MLNYIDEVNKNVSIQEGRKAIENILITIYFKEGISTKELARNSLLFIPVVSAIKKEFIKKGLVIQDRGTRLSIKGRHFIKEFCIQENLKKQYVLIDVSNVVKL